MIKRTFSLAMETAVGDETCSTTRSSGSLTHPVPLAPCLLRIGAGGIVKGFSLIRVMFMVIADVLETNLTLIQVGRR